jgi:hypothetical protein
MIPIGAKPVNSITPDVSLEFTYDHEIGCHTSHSPDELMISQEFTKSEFLDLPQA